MLKMYESIMIVINFQSDVVSVSQNTNAFITNYHVQWKVMQLHVLQNKMYLSIFIDKPLTVSILVLGASKSSCSLYFNFFLKKSISSRVEEGRLITKVQWTLLVLFFSCHVHTDVQYLQLYGCGAVSDIKS